MTGHEDPSKGSGSVQWERLAGAVDTLVVLMGTRALPEITRQLIAAGRDPATPVAVVRRGTTDDQDTVTGTLACIAERAAHLPPPAVIVIGDVVRFTELVPVPEPHALETLALT